MKKTTTGPAKVKTYRAAKKNNNNPKVLRFLYRNAKNDTGIRTISDPAWKTTSRGFVVVGKDMDNKGAIKTFNPGKMTMID